MPQPFESDARAILKSVFGYDDFRPGQWEVIEAALAGRDVFAVMPTGSGKSMCYQLPALVAGGLTLVVSPLIALMRDQVGQLTRAGVAAASLNSMNSEARRPRPGTSSIQASCACSSSRPSGWRGKGWSAGCVVSA
jgi:ATP-dependent DNA helicase RecQ